MNAEQIVKKYEDLKGQRSVWESHWQECAEFVMPQKANITHQGTPGEKRGAMLFDSTAAHANELLAGALHGMLTNPSSRFFDLRTGDQDLDADQEVRAFLDGAADKMTYVMNNSNFQTEIHEVYLDLTGFGTAGIITEDDDELICRFSSRPIQELYVEENNKGFIDTVLRPFCWNARQMAQEFGEEALPKEIKEKLAQGSSETFEIIHAVYPRNQTGFAPEFAKTPKGARWAAKYVLVKTKTELKEDGFHEWPVAVPRWTKTSREKYGRSPTMKALADVKMINKMKETTLKAAQKATDPPLMAPDDGFLAPVTTIPGGINYYRSGTQDRIEALPFEGKVEIGFQLIADTKTAIREAYYVDQLQLEQGGPQMTATEVDRRTEDALRLLGPMLGRLQSELLQPLINRVFSICLRRGVFKIPSSVHQKLSKKRLIVQYSSLVARAQRISEGNNIQRWVNAVAPFVTADPEIMDNIDGDSVALYAADIFGLPSKLLRDKDDRDKMRKGRMQAKAQLAQQEQQQSQADQIQKVIPAAAQATLAQQAQQKGAQ